MSEDLAAEMVSAIERSADRILQLEQRMDDLEKAVRDSLDQIQAGMAEMRKFLLERQKLRQSPASGLLN